MPNTVTTRTVTQKKRSPVVQRKKPIPFHRGGKIPRQFHDAYTLQLWNLRRKVQSARGRSYQASDIFKTLSKDPSRIIVKRKFSYLYPDAMGQMFSQTYDDPDEVQGIKETIVTYFNAFFFSGAPDPGIDLTRLDGEGIFTGKIDLLLNALKEALRRLFSYPHLLPSPNVSGHPPPPPSPPPPPPHRESKSCFDWDPKITVFLCELLSPVQDLDCNHRGDDFQPSPSSSTSHGTQLYELPPEHHRSPLPQSSTPMSEVSSQAPDDQDLLDDFMVFDFDSDGYEYDFTTRVETFQLYELPPEHLPPLSQSSTPMSEVSSQAPDDQDLLDDFMVFDFDSDGYEYDFTSRVDTYSSGTT